MRSTHSEPIDRTGFATITAPAGARPLGFQNLYPDPSVATLSFFIPDDRVPFEPITFRIERDGLPLYDEDSPLGDYVGSARVNGSIAHCFWLNEKGE